MTLANQSYSYVTVIKAGRRNLTSIVRASGGNHRVSRVAWDEGDGGDEGGHLHQGHHLTLMCHVCYVCGGMCGDEWCNGGREGGCKGVRVWKCVDECRWAWRCECVDAYHERERLCPEGVRVVEIAHVHYVPRVGGVASDPFTDLHTVPFTDLISQ